MMRPDRPRKQITQPPLPLKAEAIISRVTFFVDMVTACLYAHRVPSIDAIKASMEQRLGHECKRLREIRDEMEELREPYDRFLDLQQEERKRERRAERILGVLAGPSDEDSLSSDDLVLAADLPPAGALRHEVKLWEAMKEYLHYVPEARVIEMQDFFQRSVQIMNSNRYAIESALRRHPETFTIRKKGREKFISLKQGKE